MTKEEVRMLLMMLERFRSWVDDLDSKSIEQASSDKLAGRLLDRHQHNSTQIGAVTGHVKALEHLAI